MSGLFKQFDDPSLARKFALLRAASLLFGVLVVVAVALIAASGEMSVRGSRNGGRFISDGVMQTVAWSDSPIVYLVATAWYVAIGLLFVASIYLALAKCIEKLHGRPLFRRKYPH